MKPTGNVTFLFTDIEGSTRLAQDYPDTLHSALEKHNSILRNTVEINNGFVFKIVGDAYFCAFHNAADAVNAAIDIQTALANEKWDVAVIKIRIGIHSGIVEWNGNDYMGYITLARVARVMSAAYGEQILISNDTYKLFSHHKNTKTQRENESNSLCRLRRISDLVVKNVCFRDLGERRLKDVIEPIRLYQVESEGLRKEFPPLNTLDARPNNLPIQLTNFIGREKEIRHAKELLKDNRLVTLTGSGGAGKTRLSLQTGADMIDDFANGVWFIEFAAISDPLLLPVTIINALNLKEEPNKTPEETLTDHLKDKEILIILDNCEHLIHECAAMSERLLLQCPKVKIIATSREALNITGEQIYRIPPLSLPDPNSGETPEQLSQYESVRLFIERALAVNTKFRVTNENASALAEVCSRLDGIPLALELAAARTKILSVEKIFERLDDRFNLLTGGKRTALPRQQTLRALIDWSYDLLSVNEKILWSRLSLFSGGWTLEAAEEVCSDEKINKNEILDLLSHLTEKSVIIYDESKERYRILESIKQYGQDKLTEENEIFLRHLHYFLELSEKANPGLKSENVNIWLNIFEADHNNFRLAIEWGVKNKNTEKAAQVAAALGRFWFIRGYNLTGIKIINIILDKQNELSKSSKSKILSWNGMYHSNKGDYKQAQKFLEESLVLRRELGDDRGIATSLNGLGNVAFYLGDYELAKKYDEECLMIRRKTGDKRGMASSLNGFGNVAFSHGDYDQAQKYTEESLALYSELGDKRGVAASLNCLGNIANYRGIYEQAEKYYEESLELCREMDDKLGIAASLNNLGILAKYSGDYEKAINYYKESLIIRREQKEKRGIAYSLIGLGNVSYLSGDYEQAQKYLKESLFLRLELLDKEGIANSILSFSEIFFVNKDYCNLVKLISAAETALESMGAILYEADKKTKDGYITKLREKLSDEEFAKCREEGKKMTLEEAGQLIIDS